MANTYLEEGSYGYMGSATISYGPADSLGAADLICQYFLTSVLGGASCGRALLEARQRFVAEGNTSPTDLKTLAQFSLMGDPSIHPVDPQGPYRSWTPVEPHGAGPDASGLGRSGRRDSLRQVGAALSNVPAARLVEDDERGPEVDDTLSQLAEAAGGGFGEIRTFVLEPPAPAQGDRAPIGPEVRIHVLSAGQGRSRRAGAAAIPEARVLEVREEGGEVVASRLLVSR